MITDAEKAKVDALLKQERDEQYALHEVIQHYSAGVGDDGKKWPQSTDARLWALEWRKALIANSEIAEDFGCMTGWFANSIMAGVDEMNRRSKQRITELEADLRHWSTSAKKAEEEAFESNKLLARAQVKIANAKQQIQIARIHSNPELQWEHIDDALKELE